MHADVVIVGGGAIGSAIAWSLAAQQRSRLRIVVLEPDPSYRTAATARSAGSIRQQFSTPLNITLSTYGMEFLRAASSLLGTPEQSADPGFVSSTYLYLVGESGVAQLDSNIALQRRCGVPVRRHNAASLTRHFPWLHVGDLVAGADTSSGEGWFDGYALLMALRSAAQRAGVRYQRSPASGFVRQADGSVSGVRLQEGGIVSCGVAVLAAGTRSMPLAANAGIDLPVEVRKRTVFVFTCCISIDRCPLVIDPSGLWFRAEGDRFLCGPPPETDAAVDVEDFEVDQGQFERCAWPLLAHRVPAFESIRCTAAWVGHYDFNVFDQNPFVGPVPGLPGLLLATGFSGHGLQHAPAIGRGLAEMICTGTYRTIDLTPLAYERYLQAKPLREFNVI
jgi:FAD-dependent oxidoreductase domain-containing protein 1